MIRRGHSRLRFHGKCARRSRGRGSQSGRPGRRRFRLNSSFPDPPRRAGLRRGLPRLLHSSRRPRESLPRRVSSPRPRLSLCHRHCPRHPEVPGPRRTPSSPYKQPRAISFCLPWLELNTRGLQQDFGQRSTTQPLDWSAAVVPIPGPPRSSPPIAGSGRTCHQFDRIRSDPPHCVDGRWLRGVRRIFDLLLSCREKPGAAGGWREPAAKGRPGRACGTGCGG